MRRHVKIQEKKLQGEALLLLALENRERGEVRVRGKSRRCPLFLYFVPRRMQFIFE